MFTNRVFYKTVDSTNELLLKLVHEDKVQKNTVIISDFQDNGKGQLNKKWHSDRAKNLLFSFYLKPKYLLIDKKMYLNMIACLAIVYTLKEYIKDIDIDIKWPNDVRVNSHKIAGVLIKTIIFKKQIKKVVVGCGININQKKFSFQKNNPTSLFLISKKEIDKESFLNQFFDKFTNLFNSLEKGDFKFLKEEFFRFSDDVNFYSKN